MWKSYVAQLCNCYLGQLSRPPRVVHFVGAAVKLLWIFSANTAQLRFGVEYLRELHLMLFYQHQIKVSGAVKRVTLIIGSCPIKLPDLNFKFFSSPFRHNRREHCWVFGQRGPRHSPQGRNQREQVRYFLWCALFGCLHECFEWHYTCTVPHT